MAAYTVCMMAAVFMTIAGELAGDEDVESWITNNGKAHHKRMAWSIMIVIFYNIHWCGSYETKQCKFARVWLNGILPSENEATIN